MEPLRQDYKMEMEEHSTAYNGHFPEDLPPRAQPRPAGSSLRDRLKYFSTFSIHSYSLIHTEDGAARMRHIAMILILALRAAQSALSILWAVVKGKVPEIILYSILAVITMWFTATCLAIIGDAKGERKFLGVTVKRWHLDAFLYFSVIIHAVLLITFFFGLGGRAMDIIGLGMWVLIIFVAYVAGWKPDTTAFQRVWVGKGQQQQYANPNTV